MKNYEESKNRFHLSEKHPNEYPVESNDDAMCVEIAAALGESNMRYILARRHQLGMQAIHDAYAAVKDSMRKGQCRSPRKLFNSILTRKLAEKNQI